jgi:pimeloyl-ACP methyl ester carboxylesterase
MQYQHTHRTPPFGLPLGLIVALGLALLANAVAGVTGGTATTTAEAGFVELEPISFSFQREGPFLGYQSSRARIFYNFHPFDLNGGDPTTAPLFVFFNGGPGCATCDGLLSINTAPYTLYPAALEYKITPIQNPHSWSRIGHLLYIDAPNTGYSYNLATRPDGATQTAPEFDAQNFNPYIDAAQMVRVLLRFLQAHPQLSNHPVVLVGESYGGTRVSTMLSMLLNYRRYAAGADVYRDAGLVREVQAHLDRYFAVPPGRVHAPAAIARQFGRQILIDPQLTGHLQSAVAGELFEKQGSVIYQLAAAHAKTFAPCTAPGCEPSANAISFVTSEIGLSPYDTRQDASREIVVMFLLAAALGDIDSSKLLTGYDITRIPGFYASQRTRAYHLKVPADLLVDTQALELIPPAQRAWFSALPQGVTEAQSDLADRGVSTNPLKPFKAVFGELHSSDAFFVPCPPMDTYNAFYWNSAIAKGYDIDPESARYGRLFLENLPLVKTLITDAAHDLIVYPPSLAPSLALYPDLVKSAAAKHTCAGCDGVIEVEYQPTATAKLRMAFPRVQRIWFPHYAEAGHSVAAGMPEKLVGDVAAWMAGTKP